MTTTWQERLVIERDDLAARLGKLKLFLMDDAEVEALERADAVLLQTQMYAMQAYLDILDRRLVRARK